MNIEVRRASFFLGGQDLEMQTIRQLLDEHAPGRCFDLQLHWGAKASAYEPALRIADDQGQTVVTVELPWDLPWRPAQLIEIDHHGARAGMDRPSSLHQVFELLELPQNLWTRWLELVAANDGGYVEAMLAVGANPAEIQAVRAADRKAQGITDLEETQAQQALLALEYADQGWLTIARLPHNRTAALADRLHPALGGPGYTALLILSPNESNFFGSGAQIDALNQAFPGGWYGGALPKQGFWGCAHSLDASAVEAVIRSQ